MIALSEADVARLIDSNLALSAAEIALCETSENHSFGHGRLTQHDDEASLRALTIMGRTSASRLVVKTNLHAGGDDGTRSGSLLTLWDTDTASPLALIAAAGLNDHRTAAGFAVAARRMSRPKAQTLAVFGAGKLAGPTIRYMCCVRPIRRVLIVSRSQTRARPMIETLRARFAAQGVQIDFESSPANAAAAADILVTVTTAKTPVFPGAALRPGTMVVLGGANRPTAREADDDFARRALVVADDATRCLEGAGDICAPLASGALSADRVIDGLGAFTASTRDVLPADGILAFKSMGLARQDAILAEAILRRARARNIGQIIEGFGATSSHHPQVPQVAPMT